jgi:predicted lipoprotein with Yx(FWY)xxD motif
MPVSSTAATIHTAKATVGGTTETILVNGKGLPLYFYKPDTATRSMVTGTLAALWPPLDSTAPSENSAAGALKVVDTSNGSQVTYNGHFLYTFAEDSPGQVTGQGVQDFFVATPGMSASHGGSTQVSTAPSSTGNGYGY